MSGSDRDYTYDESSKSADIIVRKKHSREHLNTDSDFLCTNTQARRKKNHTYKNGSLISNNLQLTNIPFVFANDTSIPIPSNSSHSVILPSTSSQISEMIPSPPVSQLPSSLPPKLQPKKEKGSRKSSVTSSFAFVDQNKATNENTLEVEKRPKKYNKKVHAS